MSVQYGTLVKTDYVSRISVDTVSSTDTTLTVDISLYLVSILGTATNETTTWSITINNSTTSGSKSVSFSNGSVVSIATRQVTLNKTYSGTTIICSATFNCYAGASPVSIGIFVPAITSYTVTYDANNGTGAPNDQNKWHGEALSISTIRPTRSGYKFNNWTYTYSGSTYTINPGDDIPANRNANITLVANWVEVYSNPDITGINLFRCDANGNQLDEGTYAKLELSWRVNHSSAAPSSITIRYRKTTTNTWSTAYASYSFSSGQTSGTVNTLIYSNSTCTTKLSFTAKASYVVEVTFNDVYSGSNHSAKTTRTLSAAYFNLDLKPGDKETGGIGIGHSADISGVVRIGMDVQIDGYRTASNNYERGNFSCVDSRLPADSSSSNKSESVWGNGLFFYGTGFNPNSGNPIYKAHGYVRGVNLSNGSRGVQIEAQRYVNGTRTTNALNVTVDSSGNGHATLGGTGIFMCHGSVGQTISVPANSYGEYTINYGHTYSSAPHVFPVLYSTTSTSPALFGGLTLALYDVGVSSAKVRIYNNTSTARTPGLHWLAIGD